MFLVHEHRQFNWVYLFTLWPLYEVDRYTSSLMQISNLNVTAAWCIKACRQWSRGSVLVQTKHPNGEEIRSQWIWPWNDCWGSTRLVWPFQKTLISWNFYVRAKTRKHPVSGSLLGENALCGTASYGRLPVINVTTEKHLWTHNTSNLEVDGLQQQKPISLKKKKIYVYILST